MSNDNDNDNEGLDIVKLHRLQVSILLNWVDDMINP